MGSPHAVASVAGRALLAGSAFGIAVGLVSILTSILTSLNERRREMSILRPTGARPHHNFLLLVFETAPTQALDPCARDRGIGRTLPG